MVQEFNGSLFEDLQLDRVVVKLEDLLFESGNHIVVAYTHLHALAGEGSDLPLNRFIELFSLNLEYLKARNI